MKWFPWRLHQHDFDMQFGGPGVDKITYVCDCGMVAETVSQALGLQWKWNIIRKKDNANQVPPRRGKPDRPGQ